MKLTRTLKLMCAGALRQTYLLIWPNVVLLVFSLSQCYHIHRSPPPISVTMVYDQGDVKLFHSVQCSPLATLMIANEY